MADKLGGEANARRAAFLAAALALLCILTLPPVLQAQVRTERATATFGGGNYVVQAGDQLRVRIWGWPEPSTHTEGTFPVEQSGVVYLPVIGELKVAGRTAQDIQTEFRNRFAQEQRNPVVTVEAIFAVSVMGEVRLPGVVDVTPGYTLFDALSVAGGYTEAAKRTIIMLVRGGNTQNIEGATAADLAAKLSAMRLESGDRVVVPRANTPHATTVFYFFQALLSAASFVVLLTRN